MLLGLLVAEGPGMRIHQVSLTHKTLKQLDYMDRMCFPTDDPYPKEKRHWWFVSDEQGPVGFAGLDQVNDHTGFLCRAGVFQRFQGQGLHRKLILAREKKARALGLDTLVTHVMPWNIKSVNNLMHMGYYLIKPLAWFHFQGALHFRKVL
jgi:GNAT superfamily N-acetyltransferase